MLKDIRTNPLTVTNTPADIRGVISAFIDDIQGDKLNPPAPGDTESSHAKCHTLTHQRRVAVRQLMAVMTMAMQLADEKGILVPAAASASAAP